MSSALCPGGETRAGSLGLRVNRGVESGKDRHGQTSEEAPASRIPTFHFSPSVNSKQDSTSISWEPLKHRRKVQRRGLLLLFLRVQLLLAGAFLFWNHHRHGCASFLCFLIQDKPEEGEELLFLGQVSSAEIPHQDVYSNLSQIHPVDIGGPLKVMIPENLTMEQVVEKNTLVELGGQYWPPDCWTQHYMARQWCPTTGKPSTRSTCSSTCTPSCSTSHCTVPSM